MLHDVLEVFPNILMIFQRTLFKPVSSRHETIYRCAFFTCRIFFAPASDVKLLENKQIKTFAGGKIYFQHEEYHAVN